MGEIGTVVLEIERPPKEIIEGFRTVSAASVHESMNKTGVMDSEIKPIVPNVKLVGPAITVSMPPRDNLMLHKALTIAKPGDVLVITSQGFGPGTWGGLVTVQAIARGMAPAGVVTDGYVRDVAEVRKARYPCFAKGISPQGATKELLGFINLPIQCGGVIANPGDIIIGDDDGVVVVPSEMAKEVLEKAREREAKEANVIQILKKGEKTLYDLYGFDKILKQRGVNEIRGPIKYSRGSTFLVQNF